MEYQPCDPQRHCRLRDTGGCFEDLDHLASPKSAYRTPLERAYRNLPENKQKICRQLHNERHATEGHRPKPSEAEMRRAVNEHHLSQLAVKEVKIA